MRWTIAPLLAVFFISHTTALRIEHPEEDWRYLEGDIISYKRSFSARSFSTHSNLSDPRLRWSSPIYYYVDPSLEKYRTSLIQPALRELEKVSCISFAELNTAKRTQWPDDYLWFNSSQGCASFIGRRGGPQIISLEAETCTFFGIALHEILHSLGFGHEHNRPDRNESINVIWENVDPDMGNFLYEYSYSEMELYGEAYDYGSILHGSNFLFAVNDNYPTITAKTDPNMILGQREKLSDSDIRRLNKHFSCPSSPSMTSPTTPTTLTTTPTTTMTTPTTRTTTTTTTTTTPTTATRKTTVTIPTTTTPTTRITRRSTRRTTKPTTATTTETPTTETLTTQTPTTAEEPPTPNGNRCDGVTFPALLPNPLNCAKFFICHADHTYEMNCPSGLYFNPQLLVCDWPWNVPCGNIALIGY